MPCHQQHLPFVKHLAERDGWHEWPACSFDIPIPIPIQPSRASRLVREASLPLLTQPHQVAAAAPNTHQSQQPLVAQGPSLLCGEWRILLSLSPMHAWLQVVAGAWVGGSVALGGHIPPPTSLPSSPFPSSLLGVHLSFVMGSNDAADPAPHAMPAIACRRQRCTPLGTPKQQGAAVWKWPEVVAGCRANCSSISSLCHGCRQRKSWWRREIPACVCRVV